MIKNKFFNALTIALILFQAIAPIGALAATGTNQPDYAPGSVVTVSGDNSDGAGFQAGETVHVDVTGPNSYAAACDATADDNAAWSCQVTLSVDAADGSYSYIATGQTSAVSQSGGSTVTAPATPTTEPTQAPTAEPTDTATDVPTVQPTDAATDVPTAQPTDAPTDVPTVQPTDVATDAPTAQPTDAATDVPTIQPADTATNLPTVQPTDTPTIAPTPTAIIAPSGTFITSDKDDYFAGELVTLTSGHWQPNESVHLIVNDVIGNSWVLATDVVADANGAFVYKFNLPNWFVAQYHVYAYGAISGATTTDFTDSRTINSATVNGVSSVTVATGASISAAVSVTTDNGGGNNNWNSTSWRIATSPAGGSATCVNHADHTSSATFIETFSITAPASPGTYNAYFIAYSNDTCTNGASGTLTLTGAVIVKSNQTINVTTSAPATATYNATFNVVATATSGLSVAITTSGSCSGSGSGSATITMTSGTGTCTVNYDQTGNTNFFAAPQVTQTTTAQKANQNITVGTHAPATAVYNTGFTVAATASSGLSVTYSASGSCTNVGANFTMNSGIGTCTVKYDQAGNSNYNAATQVTESVTAQKANQTITFGALSAKTFGDADFGVSATASSGLAVSFSSQTLSKCTVTGSTVHIAAAGSCTIRASQSGDSNYNAAANVDQSFNIGKATPSITWANPADITYGIALGATQLNATASVPGSFVYIPASGTVLNAGNNQTLHVDFTPTDIANYNTASKDVSVNVLKASSTTVVSCEAGPFTYNGSAQTPCSVSVTGAGGLNLTPDPDYVNNIDAGTATASYTYDGDANHTGSSDTQDFEIGQASSTTVVSCEAGPFTYNGSAQTPCSVSVTGAGGLNLTPDPDYVNNIDAGTATASYTYDGDANHTGSSDTQDFEIGQASSTTVVSCEAGPFTYNSSAQTPCSVSVTGAGGLNLTPDPDYVNNIDAGTATASYTYDGDANHTGSSDTQDFEIGQASSTTVVSCEAGPFTYNGSAQTPCSVSVTGAGGLNLTPDPDYVNNIDAGTATASYTYDGDANHTGSSDTQDFEIGQASSTTVVSCEAGPFTYNGSAQTPCSVSVTGAGGLNLTPDPDYVNNIDAGTATASYTYDGDANHTGSSDTQDFEIGQASSTTVVSCEAGPFTYNGSAQTPCSVSVTGAGGLNLTPDPDYVNNIDAGTATASYTYDGDANHTGSSDTQDFEIGQASSTTVVSCEAGPFTYNSSAQTPCSVSVTGAGGLNLTPDPDYVNNIDAGTATASYTYDGDANHTGSSDTQDFEIGQASSTTVVSCEAGPFTYNGSAQTPCSVSVTGAGGLNLTPDPDYVNNIDAGTATASYTYDGDANHTGSSDSKTFTIDKASSTTAVSCPAHVTYTGSPLTPCTVSITGAGGLSLTPDADYADNTNAGTATASYTFVGDANHTGSSDSKTFTIDKASSTTAVSCPAHVTYTGSPLTPCTVSVTGAGGLSLTPDADYADNTNAGTATASYTFAGDANHTGSSDSKTFTIDKASSTTAVSCPAHVTYTGSPLTPCTVSVTGAGGLSLTPTPTYLNNTNAGTASASYTFAGDANHFGSSDSKTFTIDKAPSATTVTCTAGPFTYTGLAQTPCSVTVTGAGSLNLTPAPVYTNNVNVGTATASYTYAGDANHTGSSDSKNFTINKAPSTTTVTCPVSVIYTGSAQTPCTASYSGVGGLSGTLTPTYSNNVNVGTATATATYAGDANHNGSSDSKTFSILYATSGTCLGEAGHAILQPINADGTSVFKQGSTVPAKFRVCDAAGHSIGTVGVISSFRLIQTKTGTLVANVDEAVDSTTPDSAFRWSATDQQWIFNLNTKSLKANTTYYYDITLNDGSHILFQFGLK